jgi:serine/threonine protein kinase
MKGLRHPHVVKLYDVIRDDKHEILVLECLNGGELFE